MDLEVRHDAATFDLIAGRTHYERVVEAVLKAEVSVWIATANLKDLMYEWRRAKYRSLLYGLDQLAKDGVELRLLHAGYPSKAFRKSFDEHRWLTQRMELRLCPRVHFKVVVIDGRLAYMGSANWTGAGLGVKGDGRRNFEMGMMSEDEAFIDHVQTYYDHLWRGEECKVCRLRASCEFPLDLIDA